MRYPAGERLSIKPNTSWIAAGAKSSERRTSSSTSIGSGRQRLHVHCPARELFVSGAALVLRAQESLGPFARLRIRGLRFQSPHRRRLHRLSQRAAAAGARSRRACSAIRRFANSPSAARTVTGRARCMRPKGRRALRRRKALTGRSSIPPKLPPRLAEDICMNCHQGSDTRVLRPGKDYFDFRPGTPLRDTLAILRIPLKRDAASESDLLEHHFSMQLSQCYRASDGRLSCLTCHQIHSMPRPAEAGRVLSCAVPHLSYRGELQIAAASDGWLAPTTAPAATCRSVPSRSSRIPR